MIVSSATSGDGLSLRTWLILIVLGLAWAVGYIVACRVWPLTKCRKCAGTGRHQSPSGKAWRKCRRCKGSASRIRTGRLILNKLKITSEEASK